MHLSTRSEYRWTLAWCFRRPVRAITVGSVPTQGGKRVWGWQCALRLPPHPLLFVVVQSLKLCPALCNPVDVAHQVPLSSTISQSLLKLMSIELVMLSISSSAAPISFAFNLSQHQGLFQSWFFPSGGQIIGVSASASVLPMNIKDWFLLGVD